jgi:hypothetical protein
LDSAQSRPGIAKITVKTIKERGLKILFIFAYDTFKY